MFFQNNNDFQIEEKKNRFVLSFKCSSKIRQLFILSSNINRN